MKRRGRGWARLLPTGAPGADDLRHRARLGAILAGRLTPAEIDRIHAASLAARTVRNLQFLRCHHPRGWQPECTIVGGEHLSRALALGRGAILWVTPFAYASIATKATLHRHGLPLTHLSRWEHGPSKTRWGVAWLNPIQRLAEDRFLRERVTIGEGRDPLAALRRLGICLAENRVVSITLGEEASSTVDVPFLAGTLKVPLGPIKLALRTGAPLLPTHTVGIGPAQFETTIEPALPVGSHGSIARRSRKPLGDCGGAVGDHPTRAAVLARRVRLSATVPANRCLAAREMPHLRPTTDSRAGLACPTRKGQCRHLMQGGGHREPLCRPHHPRARAARLAAHPDRPPASRLVPT